MYFDMIKEFVKKNLIGVIVFLLGILSFIGSIVYVTLNKCHCEVCDDGVVAYKSDILPTSNEIEESIKEEVVSVDVKGAVKKSGVYSLKLGSNVDDAIKMAGGITKNGVTSNINLSKKLTDEMVIYVFTKSEIEKSTSENKLVCEVPKCECESIDIENACIVSHKKEDVIQDTSVSDGKISINTDSVEELTKLDGIGESRAKTIIEYRKKNGDFTKLEDIMNVSGIGDKAYQKIKDNIKL